jgi:hypothetical protein
MKIGDPNSRPISGLDTTVGAAPRSGRTPNAGELGQRSYADDQVQLSNLSTNLSAGQSNSAARLAKLSQLGAEVGTDRYHADAGQVAASVIQATARK